MNKSEKRKELQAIIETANKELVALQKLSISDFQSYSVFVDSCGKKKVLLPINHLSTEPMFILAGLFGDINKVFSDGPQTASEWFTQGTNHNWIYIGKLALEEEK